MKICKFHKNVNDILKPHDTSFHCVLNKILDTRLGLKKVHLPVDPRLDLIRPFHCESIIADDLKSEAVKMKWEFT